MTAQEWVRSVVACSGVGQDPAGAATTCSSVGQGHSFGRHQWERSHRGTRAGHGSVDADVAK
jgi:hypothetical protein